MKWNRYIPNYFFRCRSLSKSSLASGRGYSRMLASECENTGWRNLTLFFLAICAVCAFSCNKEDTQGDRYTLAEDRVKDSAWNIAKDIYLWNSELPKVLNIKTLKDPDGVMQAIRPYSLEPGFSSPVDRWSFAIKKSEWNKLGLGISVDMGLGIFFRSENDLRVSYVEPASPAASAGVKRGWRIMAINGDENISTDNEAVSRISTAIFNSRSAEIMFKKPDGNEATISLAASSYQEEPILLDTVYSNGMNKTGYFVFNSFLGDINTIKGRIESLFTKFSNAGIQDLIVDLRYNGGGYVELQNDLANYLAPSAANKNVMLKELFNDNYRSLYDTTISYLKKGQLNLHRIFFIITKNTASASELLINSLKPYMEVKLIGRPSNGKPVGFYNIGVGDWYVFPVSFRIVNKNGEGNYFNGLQPDAIVDDGLDKPWGDVQENCLASALHYIYNGVYARVSSRTQPDFQLERGNTSLGVKRFKGAIETAQRRGICE